MRISNQIQLNGYVAKLVKSAVIEPVKLDIVLFYFMTFGMTDIYSKSLTNKVTCHVDDLMTE